MSSLPYAAAVEEALAGFQAAGPAHRNCAQTMINFAALRLGRPVEACEIARYLGAGVARQGLTCGVLTGATLALGLADSALPAEEAAERTASRLQDLQSLTSVFVTAFGATDCATLTGCNLLTAEGLAQFRESGARHGCTTMVTWTMENLDPLLQKWV